jgi:hypothetical protein
MDVLRREDFPYDFKGGRFARRRRPGCGQPQAAVLAGRHGTARQGLELAEKPLEG